jgi:aspartate aminotransferase
MVRYSSRLDGIKTSGVRKMFEMAKRDAIQLGLGEPDFNPPPEAIEALKKAVDEGKNSYASIFGLKELRDAVAGYCGRYMKGLTSDNIVITQGGSEALMVTAMTLYDKDDEILIPDPGFVFYKPHAMLNGARPVAYAQRQENEFVPTQDDLLENITPKTKAIVVNFPNNPCGSTLTKADRDMIVDIAKDKDLTIVTDEVYDLIIYESEHVSFLGHHDNLVFINSFSKSFAATGWRIGYLASPDPEMAEKLGMMHYYTVACPTTPIQWAVLTALESCMAFPDMMLKEFRKRRKVIVDLLNEIDGVHCLMPKGAFYVLPKVDVTIPDPELATEIVKAGVICSPGSAFGPAGAGHIRFSYANNVENIEKGISIVEQVIKKFRK